MPTLKEFEYNKLVVIIVLDMPWKVQELKKEERSKIKEEN